MINDALPGSASEIQLPNAINHYCQSVDGDCQHPQTNFPAFLIDLDHGAYLKHTAAGPTVWTGDHRSLATSYPWGSSPGLCRMDMHTRPSV